jgi:hypothetical protein
MATRTDVTDKVEFFPPDVEVYIHGCLCGYGMDGDGSFQITDEKPNWCPSCGRKFAIEVTVKVFEVDG